MTSFVAKTITRAGAVLPVEIRTARKRHSCNDCPEPIMPGDRHELSVTPPHQLREYCVPRWLKYRTHYPRHDGHRFLPGCAEVAAYRENDERESAIRGLSFDERSEERRVGKE